VRLVDPDGRDRGAGGILAARAMAGATTDRFDVRAWSDVTLWRSDDA
jgi:hypothetical protein